MSRSQFDDSKITVSLFFLDFADNKITPKQNLSTSWSTRLKEATTCENRDNALSNDIFDPLFQIDEDYAPFVESDEEESSGK